MKYVEAFSEEHPSRYSNRYSDGYPIVPWEHSLFLGGGITNCYDWQADMCQLLKDTNLVLLNPRRKHWPKDDPEATDKQIRWEFEHLKIANAILFWFAPETLCPITLFEYGKWLVKDKPLFVGCHPQYQKILDVQVQTSLERENLKVHTSLEELANEIISSIPFKIQ
jgi:hypothetical protein